jgi:hypothetical protein
MYNTSTEKQNGIEQKTFMERSHQARSQKLFFGGDRHTKKLLFVLRQVINLSSPPGI